MSAAVEYFSRLTPTLREIERGQRLRRVWAALSEAQAQGRPMPGMREIARSCGLPSSSTAQACVEMLEALGVVEVAARHARGGRRVTSALRVTQPFGWESYL